MAMTEPRPNAKDSSWHLDQKVTIGMIATFLIWAVSSTWVVTEWKTQIDDKIDQLLEQTLPLPDHEHRMTVLETQLPAIKEGVDGLGRKLDLLIDKLTKAQP